VTVVGLARGRNTPEVTTEPAPGFVYVRAIVEGVASCGIRGEHVAEAGPKVDFERGRVCARGPSYALVILCVPSRVGRQRARTVVACVIVVGEA
jgi:hypothetical protein